MAGETRRNSTFDRVVGEFCARLVAYGRSRGSSVLIGAVLLAAACLGFASVNLGINSDIKAMLSDDLPFRRLVERLGEAFPSVGEPLIIVIDGETPEDASDAALALAEKLGERPDLFKSVFAPGVGRFFEQHGLLYADVETLEEFSDRIIAALPFISMLAREPTIDQLYGLITSAITREDPGRLTPARIPDLMSGVATILEAPLEDGGRPFSWRRWILGEEEDSKEGTRRVVLAQPIQDFSDTVAARRPIAAIRSAVEDLGYGRDDRLVVRITGNPALGADEITLVAEQAGVIAVIASFIGVAVVLSYALGSARLVFATVAPLLLGLAYTTGFAAAAVGHLNLVSIAFAVLFIGLGVDFGIHFSLRFRDMADAGFSLAPSLEQAGREVGGSITLCAATTAIGFYSFVPTRYSGVAELGLIAGTGMFISLAVTLIVAPAILAEYPPRTVSPSERRAVGRFIRGLVEIPLRSPVPVLMAVAASAVGAAFLLPRVYFDPDPIHVRDPNSESVRALSDLLLDSPDPPWSIEIIAEDLTEADRMAERLASLESVSRTVTLSDYVPDDQEEKLEILDDLIFFVEPLQLYTETKPEPTTAVEAFAAIEKLRTAMRERLLTETDPVMIEGMQRLDGALSSFRERIESAGDYDAEVARLENNMLGELPNWVDKLSEALDTGTVALDDLPPDLAKRYVAPDGRARIEVFAVDDFSERGALEAFVSSLQAEVPDSGGYAIEIIESSRAIVSALQQAFGSALAIVTLLLLALWRSVRDAAMVLVTLLYAALLTAAATVVLDLPFNFADVIVLPLLLGVGVDSGIHLVHRHRIDGRAEAIVDTSTSRAIFYSALTTMLSFGSLGVSSHLGIASLGRMLTTGLVFTLVANLLFLPALLALVDRGADE